MASPQYAQVFSRANLSLWVQAGGGVGVEVPPISNQTRRRNSANARGAVHNENEEKRPQPRRAAIKEADMEMSKQSAGPESGHRTGWFHGRCRDLVGGCKLMDALVRRMPEKFSRGQSEAQKRRGAAFFIHLYKAGKTKQLGEKDQSKTSIQS